jgi:hypothetical protein
MSIPPAIIKAEPEKNDSNYVSIPSADATANSIVFH